MEKIRLSKLMSAKDLCSRREADAFIERGWVYVDGARVTTLGTKVYPHQCITLDERARNRRDQAVTILLNKPIAIVSGQPEKGYSPAISVITQQNRFMGDRTRRRFRPEHLKGLAPAGRLDIDSQGLLVLTQDGRTAKRLIGSDSGIEKEYLVRVKGNLTETGVRLLNHGLSLDGRSLKPARVSQLNRNQLKFILVEGRKRQIRRMCALVGLEVVGLKRVRIGNVRLGGLPPGQWRYLRDDESF